MLIINDIYHLGKFPTLNPLSYKGKFLILA